MKNRLLCTALTMFAAVLVAAPSQVTPSAQPAQGAVTHADTLTPQSFLELAYESNQQEVAAAQLARTRASSSQVKRYAERLEADNTKALDELRKQALASSVTLPNESEGNAPEALARTDESPTLGKLSSKSGDEFDHAFLDMMISDQLRDLALFEGANIENLADSGLRKFAANQVRAAEEHLDRAEDLRNQMNPKTTDRHSPNLP